jgi:2-keto-4-pentenoate hydratase
MARDDRAEVSLTGLVQPRIEPEICFKLKHAPRDWTDPERLLESTEWIAHSVEIVQWHHPDGKFRLADCTADNGLHGRLVVGSSMRIVTFHEIVENLPRLSVFLKKQGEVIDRGSGENVLGSRCSRSLT